MSGGARIRPLSLAEWSPEAREAFGAISTEATAKAAAASNVVMTMAQHPALAKAYLTFGRHILMDSTLNDRVRELVTLRVVRRYPGGEYEWHHHVRFAEQLGFSAEEIEAIKLPLGETGFEGVDLLALRAADEMCEQHGLSDGVWTELGAHLTVQQIMDLTYTVGLYVLSSWTKGALGICIEEGAQSSRHPFG